MRAPKSFINTQLEIPIFLQTLKGTTTHLNGTMNLIVFLLYYCVTADKYNVQHDSVLSLN